MENLGGIGIIAIVVAVAFFLIQRFIFKMIFKVITLVAIAGVAAYFLQKNGLLDLPFLK